MYELNLIHEKVIPISQQRTRLSLVSLYLLIWALTATVFAYYIITTQNEITTYQTATRRLETRNALPRGLTRADVVALSRQLEITKTMLTSVNDQTFRWSNKLNSLRKHLPPTAWLDEVSCRRSTTRFNTKPRAGNQPPLPLSEVVIMGMVMIPEGQAGSQALEEFVIKLQKDEGFMAHIQELNHVVIGKFRYGGKEAVKFMIVCVIKEGVRLDA